MLLTSSPLIPPHVFWYLPWYIFFHSPGLASWRGLVVCIVKLSSGPQGSAWLYSENQVWSSAGQKYITCSGILSSSRHRWQLSLSGPILLSWRLNRPCPVYGERKIKLFFPACNHIIFSSFRFVWSVRPISVNIANTICFKLHLYVSVYIIST